MPCCLRYPKRPACKSVGRERGRGMKGILRFLIRMLVLNIVLVPIMVLGPLLYMIPFFCIVANPQDDFSGLAQLYFWVGPLSCAFWMIVSCHWQTVRRAQREGQIGRA